MKKFLALLLAAMMLLGMTSAFAEATDTITVMVPPVTGTYLDDIDTWANDFMAEHPEIKVEVIKTSWDDHNSKLNTMANAAKRPTSPRSAIPLSAPMWSWVWAWRSTSTWMRSVWRTTTRTRWTT